MLVASTEHLVIIFFNISSYFQNHLIHIGESGGRTRAEVGRKVEEEEKEEEKVGDSPT